MEILNDAQGIILANAIYIYVYAHTDRKRKKRRVIILSHRGKSYQLELLDKFLRANQMRLLSNNLVSGWPTLLFSFIVENEMDEMKGKSYLFEWVYICPVASYWTIAQLRRYPSFFLFLFFFGSHFYIDNFVTRSYSKLPFSNFWHVSRSSDLLQI